MQDFKHRVALVTGASTGIGEAIAAELFRRGATVVMTGRHAAPLAAAARARSRGPTGDDVADGRARCAVGAAGH